LPEMLNASNSAACSHLLRCQLQVKTQHTSATRLGGHTNWARPLHIEPPSAARHHRSAALSRTPTATTAPGGRRFDWPETVGSGQARDLSPPVPTPSSCPGKLPRNSRQFPGIANTHFCKSPKAQKLAGVFPMLRLGKIARCNSRKFHRESRFLSQPPNCVGGDTLWQVSGLASCRQAAIPHYCFSAPPHHRLPLKAHYRFSVFRLC
jgi:hypothetical protein